MKPLPSLLLLALGAAILLGLAPPALAVPFDNNPKILLHVRTPTLKNQCTVGQLTNCQSAVTEGDLNAATFYYVYVLGARGSLASLAAVQFGIQYQAGCPANVTDQVGIDILSWTTCATLQFTAGDWPRPGSGALITWDAVNACQVGETGVAGFFYLGCYGPDLLQITRRPVDNQAKVVDCNSQESVLSVADLGTVRFSPGAASPGCNPCDGPCVPAGPTVCGDPTDTTAPNAITDLDFVMATASAIKIDWTVPADNVNGSGLAAYLGRISTSPITEANFDLAQPIFTPTPGTPGHNQSQTTSGLTPEVTYYFALKVRDNAGNLSAMSNVAIGTTLSGPGGGGKLNDARMLLHLGPVISNPVQQCAGGQIADCQDAVTAGALAPARYYAYLLVADAGDLAGFSCGITYDGGQAGDQIDGDRVDVLSWTLCASLEFISPSTPLWPAPGGGNLVIWDTQTNCQTLPVAVGGFFYLTAYGADVMSIIPRPADNKNSVSNCQNLIADLPTSALGSLRFTALGKESGLNPCGSPTPVQPTTWSRVKVLNGTGTALTPR